MYPEGFPPKCYQVLRGESITTMDPRNHTPLYSYSQPSRNCAPTLSLRQVRGEAGGVKRALALIRDHADILRLNEKDAAPEGRLAERYRQLL